MTNQGQKLQKRCSREELMKNQSLALLFGPRIGFWWIFGAWQDPKMQMFGFPAPPFFQTIFALFLKRVRTALQRPREMPGSFQGPCRGSLAGMACPQPANKMRHADLRSRLPPYLRLGAFSPGPSASCWPWAGSSAGVLDRVLGY